MPNPTSPESAWQALYDVAATQEGFFTTRQAAMALENELAWPTLEQLTAVVASFLNPVLAGRAGVWQPTRWSWD